MNPSTSQLFFFVTILAFACVPFVQCGKAISTIECQKIRKYPKRFAQIPELEFLGMKSFCQVVFLNCNIIFQKSRFDMITVSAWTSCDKVSIDFTLTNSFDNDVFKVIVPSIDQKNNYTISFISENNFYKRRKQILGALIQKDKKKQAKLVQHTFRKRLQLVV